MSTSYSCPSCGHAMSIPVHRAGTELICPACDQSFIAPDHETSGLGAPVVCASCGVDVDPSASFCSRCGAAADSSLADTLLRRPPVVTLLAVLNGIGGAVCFLLSLALLFAGSTDATIDLTVGLVYLVLGAAQIACALGLWRLAPWGRQIMIALSIVGLLGVPIGTIISALVLWYLFRPEVKVLFSGRTSGELTPEDVALLARTQHSGISVAAILIVCVLLFFVCGIISAIAIPNLLNAINRSRQKRTMADITTIATAAEAYAVDHRHYPIGATSVADLEVVLVPTYAARLPAIDGWREPLLISTAADGSWCEIASNGRDKLPGNRPGGTTMNMDCDIVYRNGSFVQWPEGIRLD